MHLHILGKPFMLCYQFDVVKKKKKKGYLDAVSRSNGWRRA